MNDSGNDGSIIALHSVRRILERHCPYHISTEAVIQARDRIEDMASTLAKSSVQNFQRLNERRERQGLRRLKRLNEWAILNSRTIQAFKSDEKNNDKGSQITREELENPKGDTMSAQTNVTKPGTSAEEQEAV